AIKPSSSATEPLTVLSSFGTAVLIVSSIDNSMFFGIMCRLIGIGISYAAFTGIAYLFQIFIEYPLFNGRRQLLPVCATRGERLIGHQHVYGIVYRINADDVIIFYQADISTVPSL